MKNRIRLTESQLHRIIKTCIKKALNESALDGEREDFETYNPWMNGDASFINGKYDIPYGFHVEINTNLGYVSIEGEDEENSYFMQGDEADDLIKQIAYHWSTGDMTRGAAVNDIISGLF